MDRRAPSELPDDDRPTNRIAPFLEKIAASQPPVSEEEPSPETHSKVREMLELVSAEAWAQCLAMPDFLEKYLEVVRQAQQSPHPHNWKWAIHTVEDCLAHLPAPHAELEQILADLKRALAEKGE